MRLLVFVTLVIIFRSAYSSHIMGGEISARRVDNVSLTYEITVRGYKDLDSSVEFGGGSIRTGDGQTYNGPFPVTRQQIDTQSEYIEFSVLHTFKGPSAAGYIISYRESNRNEDIANINNGNSGQTDFYVDAKLVIDPFVGSNSSPVLTNPPILWGQRGKIYQANHGAYDQDGDLLTYQIVEVQRGPGVAVGGHRFPNDPDFYMNYELGNAAGTGKPTFTIDAFTGILTWDAPGDLGDPDLDCDFLVSYAIAIQVHEWRKVGGSWKNLGYVTRDHNIEIISCEIDEPKFNALSDTCVKAGSFIDINLSASLPGADSLRYTAFGEPFLLTNAAIYQDRNTSVNIQWTPGCGEVRSEPYLFHLNASSYNWRNTPIPGNESWGVFVKAPEVEGLIVFDESPGTIGLTWDPYSCPNPDSLEIWRKEGDLVTDLCQLTPLEDLGFALVGKVPIDQLTFSDESILDGTSFIDYEYYLRPVFDNNNDANELFGLLTGSSGSEQPKIKVYPNPSSGEFRIEGVKPGWRFVLSDMAGNQLMSEMVDPAGLVQLRYHIPEGLYMLLIINQNGKLVHNQRLLLK